MARKKKPNTRRQVTDDQIAVLKAWIPFNQLARALGLSVPYASAIRKGRVFHKTKSP